MLRYISSFFIALILTHSAIADTIPKVTAKAWLLADQDGTILEGTHTTDKRSIASITKLMTVMVVLDSGQPLDEVLPKKLFGKRLDRKTIIDLAIVKSNNDSAKMLCDYYPTGYKACIEEMNIKASKLGMTDTKFTDPTGLLNTNESTAKDLVKLVMAASSYPEIVLASNTNAIRLDISKKRHTEFKNTNYLVGHDIPFLVSKTGFINKSGGCIVMMLNTLHGMRTVIVLGSRNTRTRIPEAYQIAMLD